MLEPIKAVFWMPMRSIITLANGDTPKVVDIIRVPIHAVEERERSYLLLKIKNTNMRRGCFYDHLLMVVLTLKGVRLVIWVRGVVSRAYWGYG